MRFHRNVIVWAADECKRQQTDPLGVVRMLDAWYDFPRDGVVSADDIIRCAAILEPRNVNGYRTTPVTFARGGSAVNAASIPRAMAMLMAHGDRTDPDGWVKEFLDIHPFEDGNGRTASILWNFLGGTIEAPKPLPYFYGDA